MASNPMTKHAVPKPNKKNFPLSHDKMLAATDTTPNNKIANAFLRAIKYAVFIYPKTA